MSINLEKGSTAEKWAGLVELIRPVAPDILLLQEAVGWHDDDDERLANAQRDLDMRGQIAASRTGFHTGVLINERTVTWGDWLPRYNHTNLHGHTELTVTIPGLPKPLKVISAHLTPYSAAAAAQEMQVLIGRVWTSGYGIIGGDINHVPPGDPEPPWSDVPPHDRSSRTVASDPVLRANHIVGEVAARGDLVDVAAHLADQRGDPRLRQYTGRIGKVRTDQFHRSPHRSWAFLSTTTGSKPRHLAITMPSWQLSASRTDNAAEIAAEIATDVARDATAGGDRRGADQGRRALTEQAVTNWRERADRLASDLVVAGELVDPRWQSAMREVPRHVFLAGHTLDEAYADDAVVTQVQTARDPAGGIVELPSSSASAPSIVAAMLEHLNVHDGMRVLEIGTGTGYNAALLCHRLGDQAVFSVDIDDDLITAAGRDLAAAGYRPALRAGDGRDGWPTPGRRVDRVLATCAVTHIPPAWITQLEPGGRIVAPLQGPGNALMVLDKTASDEVTGRFDPTARAAFMPLRRLRDSPLADGRVLGYTGRGMAQYDTTNIDPTQLRPHVANDDLRLFLHLFLPGLSIGSGLIDSNEQLHVSTPHGLVQIPLTPVQPGRWATQQRGHRLSDTVEHALALWPTLGTPSRGRYGIAALDQPDRQYIYLDEPESPISWAFPL